MCSGMSLPTPTIGLPGLPAAAGSQSISCWKFIIKPYSHKERWADTASLSLNGPALMNLIQLEASKPVQIITILKVQLQDRSIIDISDNNEKGHLKETFITSITPGTKVALSSKLMKWWTNLEYFISNPAWNNVTILINILNKGTQTKLVHRPHYAKNQN